MHAHAQTHTRTHTHLRKYNVAIFRGLKPCWMRRTGEWSKRQLQTNPSGIVCERDLMKVWGSYLAINKKKNVLRHREWLHLHFLAAIWLGWNWGRPKCWVEITQSSQAWSCAEHQCIQLGLTSPFPPRCLSKFHWNLHGEIFKKHSL